MSHPITFGKIFSVKVSFPVQLGCNPFIAWVLRDVPT